MECILCHLSFSLVSELKENYVNFHGVEKSNSYFLYLFKPDTLDRKCPKCCLMLNSNRMKKKSICFCSIIVKLVVQEIDGMIYL